MRDLIPRAIVASVVSSLVSSVTFAAIAALVGSDLVASAAYVGLLVGPFTLLEGPLSRSRRSLTLLTMLAWALALGAVLAAHAQAVYARGVLESRALEGGADALVLEWQRLGRYPPGDGALLGIRNWVWDLLHAGGVAVALGARAIDRSRVRGIYGDIAWLEETPQSRATAHVVGFLGVQFATLLAAVSTLTLLFAAGEWDWNAIVIAPLISFFVAIVILLHAVPASVAFLSGDVAVEIVGLARARAGRVA